MNADQDPPGASVPPGQPVQAPVAPQHASPWPATPPVQQPPAGTGPRPPPRPAPPPPKKDPPTEFGTPENAVANYNEAKIPAILTPGKKGIFWPGWPGFRDRVLTEVEQQEVLQKYSRPGCRLGVAVILGALACYVVFDFDDAGAFEAWLARLSPEAKRYVEQEVPIVRTPKGFVGHVWLPLAPDAIATGGWFRTQVLESRAGFIPARRVFLDKDGFENVGVRIELRAPGKHVAMAPGTAYGVHDKHPDRTWVYAGTNAKRIEGLAEHQVVSSEFFTEMFAAAAAQDDPRAAEVMRQRNERRAAVHNAARSVADLPPEERGPIEKELKHVAGNADANRAGDDFNARGTWEEVLGPAGWTPCGTDQWRRPGGSGTTASTKFGALSVFSPNAAPLEITGSGTRAYSKFAAYTLLYHGGDFSAAAKALSKAGYGAQKPKSKSKQSKAEREKEQAAHVESLRESAKKQGRAFIQLVKGEMSSSVDQAAAALVASEAAKGPNRVLFCKGGALVQRIARPDGTAATIEIKVDAQREHFGRAASFAKENQNGKVEPCDFPSDYAKAFQQRGEWQLAPLNGIVNTPVLTADGGLVTARGYDEATGVFLDVPGDAWPVAIPDRPTNEEFAAAVAVLLKPLAEFPWKAAREGKPNHDRAVAIGAILTILGRHLFPHAPIFAFTATTRGTGKSLLVENASIIGTGRAAAMMQLVDEIEMDKSLHAVFLESAPVICLDNIDRQLKSASLCTALTEPIYHRRLLGFSATGAPSTTGTTFLATGNGLDIAGDLTRRAVICSLDAEQEQPEGRSFAIGDLREYVRVHRHELVAAGLTILRHYLLAGCPQPTPPLKPFGGFEGWSKIIRGALWWMGEADPCASRERLVDDDHEREEIGRLLELLEYGFAGQLFPASRVKEFARVNPDQVGAALSDLIGPDGITSGAKIGRFFTRISGRLVGGLRLVNSNQKLGHAILWRIERVAAAGSTGTPHASQEFREDGRSDTSETPQPESGLGGPQDGNK